MVVRTHPGAYIDFDEAFEYYEEKQVGLGERFANEVNRTLIQIENHPLRARIIKGNYRIVNFKIFPFQIVYLYNKTLDRISISAIHHTAKHPKKKFRKF
jgi:plasmid stabilization system protein ParE